MVTLPEQPVARNSNPPWGSVRLPGMPTGAMKLVPPGFRVQLAPPPDSVAVARPAMPGTAPDTDSCALTVKLRLTCGAGKKTPLPAWSALMVQLPAVTNVSAPPLVIVHTPVVDEVNATARPDVAEADSVGVVPKFWLPGLAKVMDCMALGVTELDAEDAGPVPAELSAVTVKVYACPLVSPVTTMGDAAP